MMPSVNLSRLRGAPHGRRRGRLTGTVARAARGHSEGM
ncbi:hypothetical protein PACID_26990 [Acidipropionibacterium acidipropionici ATCC 4875]|uniref:Uncharacterized protein n=1 Tax=Acidipropionibacterium acidipropionici (strain ATCC 4875 / DSM 20272 / JCM 6432 / NBRC 12425 / NCIMB 8070 / 4) TaxID=1171373 RepID=K7RZK7_ACIA4|nr:hypothetical protein PACID_26990 [Acidipropionibacterium acidipropionici ATCC 4875]